MSVYEEAFRFLLPHVKLLFHEWYTIYSYQRSAVLIPVLARNVFLPHHVQTSIGAHTASCTMGTGVLSGVKVAGALCWPLVSIYRRRKGWVELCLYFPHTCFHGVDRETLPFVHYYLLVWFTLFAVRIVCSVDLHLGIIFVNKQLDAQICFMYVYFYSLHVSGSHVPIIRRINCINKTSGICHCV